MDSKFKSVDDYSFLYASYSEDIKKIGAGDAQEADSKSSLCSAAPEGKVSDFEIKGDKVLFKGSNGTVSYEEAKKKLANESFVPPCNSDYKVTSEFGPRASSVGSSNHKGIDIAPRDINGNACGDGNVQAVAVNDGEIVAVRTQAGGVGYGNYVDIEHTTSDGTKYVTRYAHLNDKGIANLKKQVRDGAIPIKAGDPIAWIGNTGSSTAPHLHVEIIVDGQRVDPRLMGW